MEDEKKIGDLVACYLTNTSEYETLMDVGIVIGIREDLKQILVVSTNGTKMWWNDKIWKTLQRN